MKKILCFILAVCVAVTAATSAAAYNLYPYATSVVQGVKAYEEANGVELETYRYYFQMPDGYNGMKGVTGKTCESWFNGYSAGAGIFWWKGSAKPDGWAGYSAMLESADEHIYYADVPRDVESIVWNNGADGGSDPSAAIYSKSLSTPVIDCTFAMPGEYGSLPDGCDSFDNCIYILNPDLLVGGLFTEYGYQGSWYHYYGNGCYGSADSEVAKCLNPDHYNGSVHIGNSDNYMVGDADLDGMITIMDATRVQLILAELDVPADGVGRLAADADRDGIITIMDATRIQNYLAELTDMEGKPLSNKPQEPTQPTEAPTQAPTEAPVTEAPEPVPTQVPTQAPTEAPTQAPAAVPTTVPTSAPTAAPTTAPTTAPTSAPTSAPAQISTEA